MQATFDTLTKAYQIIQDIRKPYPAEVSILLSMFVRPDRIEAMGDPALYLSYIRTLLDNRENVSLPDTAEPFDTYYEDCLLLLKQMQQSLPVFSTEDWLYLCIRLLENLKTPCYPVYAATVFDLNAAFPDRDLFRQTLQAFYTVLIRTSDDTLPLIRQITEHGRQCYMKGLLSGQLLSDLLIHQLSLFIDGRNFIFPRLSLLPAMQAFPDRKGLLAAWFRAEDTFLTDRSADNLSLAEYLSEESRYMRETFGWYGDGAINAGSDQICPGSGSTGHRTGRKQKVEIQSEFLNTFAYNMNQRKYISNPAIGREQELDDLALILISPKKSPILIGDAGVGKTSVVEGLAWLLQRGEVPDLLKDKTIFKLTTTSLLSGTKYVGEMEDRIRQLTTELSRYPDVILFIDEIHTIVGAGSTESSHNDISNMLKPFIDRGDIKIIGATTTQEYEAYMLPDRALARRFYPIAIEEPDRELTLKILMGTIPSMEETTRVKNGFDPKLTRELLTKLISLSAPENQPAGRMTRLPELPLSILEMAFSYAALHARQALTLEDLALAVRHTNLLKKEVRLEADRIFDLYG